MEDQNLEKTIVYVGGFELPDKNAAAHRVLNNGKILRDLGYKVVFIGISHGGEGINYMTYEGFSCWSIPYPVETIQWLRYLTSIKEVREIVKNINGLEGMIFYNYQSVALAKGLAFCEKNRIWSIVDVSEWYLASKKNPIFYILKQLDTSVRMRILNKRAGGIIAISTFLYDYYEKSRVKRIVQIPPLVDKNETKWKMETVETAKDYIKMIYAGSTSDLKDNLLLVLESLVGYKDKIRMTIVGVEKASVMPMIVDKAVQRYIDEYVEFCGKIPHIDCLKRIKESDFQIFIRPDNLVTRAGFPTKLGESFACGIPVITNCSSNISDYMVEGKNGFIVKEISVEGIQEVLEKIAVLKKDEIKDMKHYCEESTKFDYHLYYDEMKKLIEMF